MSSLLHKYVSKALVVLSKNTVDRSGLGKMSIAHVDFQCVLCETVVQHTFEASLVLSKRYIPLVS